MFYSTYTILCLNATQFVLLWMNKSKFVIVLILVQNQAYDTSRINGMVSSAKPLYLEENLKSFQLQLLLGCFMFHSHHMNRGGGAGAGSGQYSNVPPPSSRGNYGGAGLLGAPPSMNTQFMSQSSGRYRYFIFLSPDICSLLFIMFVLLQSTYCTFQVCVI